MKKTTVPGIKIGEFTEFDMSDSFVSWHTVEEAEFVLPNGSVLTARIEGADAGIVTWTITRSLEDNVRHLIAGARVETVEQAKAAVPRAVKVWRELVEKA